MELLLCDRSSSSMIALLRTLPLLLIPLYPSSSYSSSRTYLLTHPLAHPLPLPLPLYFLYSSTWLFLLPFLPSILLLIPPFPLPLPLPPPLPLFLGI